jgi:iron-sulfur cluster repair protein YtfE (RIC family)
MSGIDQANATIEQLIVEHRGLAMLVGRLRQTLGVELSPLLREFADLLEAHIRKEERILFPCYEYNISSIDANQVEIQILEVIGSAMKPKHPELLE